MDHIPVTRGQTTLDAVMVVMDEEGLFGGSLTKELYPGWLRSTTTPEGRGSNPQCGDHCLGARDRDYSEELTGKTKAAFTNSPIIAVG